MAQNQKFDAINATLALIISKLDGKTSLEFGEQSQAQSDSATMKDMKSAFTAQLDSAGGDKVGIEESKGNSDVKDSKE